MIKEVKNVEDANKCDELLTKLILDERKYNDLIDNNIVIKNHFSKMLDDEDAILLAYYLDKLIVGYILIRKINENNNIAPKLNIYNLTIELFSFLYSFILFNLSDSTWPCILLCDMLILPFSVFYSITENIRKVLGVSLSNT